MPYVKLCRLSKIHGAHALISNNLTPCDNGKLLPVTYLVYLAYCNMNVTIHYLLNIVKYYMCKHVLYKTIMWNTVPKIWLIHVDIKISEFIELILDLLLFYSLSMLAAAGNGVSVGKKGEDFWSLRRAASVKRSSAQGNLHTSEIISIPFSHNCFESIW